ncbi:hypothetical protein [Microbacterium jiangjiandongii]|uniref:hypothetical protein n=1 Tax=Microbacterium jiangjiandongii TaxID=3049071 RepID=UPI00214ABC2F|nr:hypothetical protein [Microbacterium sp. zg.Y843]MCR2814606.1 hypothetical protein [Microbacterium sp. zg.Y843]
MSTDHVNEWPRTDLLPMAFTTAEFVRGAMAAWIGFIAFATCGYALVLQAFVVVAAVFYLPWSVGALIVGAPAAYLLGWSLRRIRPMIVHVLAFGALGAGIGLVATALFLLVRGDGDGGALYYLVNVALSAVCVPLGWYWTARRALRPRVGAIDHDAVAEDAAVARGAAGAPGAAAGDGH